MTKQQKEYLEFMEYARQLSKNTIKSIHYDFIVFGDELDNATRRDVELFVMDQNKQGLSTATVNRRVASIKGYFEWQIHNGYRVGFNPAGNKIAPKIKSVSHKSITRDELDRLYQLAPNREVKTAIALMGFAGLRISEVVALGVTNHVYMDTNGVQAISLVDTKGGGERDVTLGLLPKPITNDPLSGKRGVLTENGLWRRLSNYFKDQGHKDISPHGLRATFATISTQAGVRIDVVRDTLGHASLGNERVTSRYVATVGVEEQYKELSERWGN